MIDKVDGLVDLIGVDDVDVDVLEPRGIADVLDVGQGAGLEVVGADDPVPARQQLVAQVRAQEAGASGYQAGGHGREDNVFI